ncbi:hypothetical protein KMP13_18930 [Epibacterium ulvae]|uniref:hypothetical protein n=1 Tax=Epibacterium ulvae TaxID=1156985 RepID=UPI001BFCC793|nr:hypothetical protein [Epibacterium ulvae]MBT8155896.1 hypothetical protein [Epibacterium ulvae]
MFGVTRGLAVLAVLTGTSAWAETHDVTGIGMGNVLSKVTEISPTLTLVEAHTDYTGFAGGNGDNPMASATGPCVGTVLVNAGQPTGNGLCNFADKDGDTLVVGWSARAMSQDGCMHGTWTVEGGTGKWDKASGGGAFNSGVNATGKYTNMISGAAVLP